MKAIITLQHPDDVSGCTIFDDGSKAYWTEGRGSYVLLVMSIGVPVVAHNSDDTFEQIAVMNRGDESMANGRPMTFQEEIEYNIARRLVGIGGGI